jgi:hypothetical protein
MLSPLARNEQVAAEGDAAREHPLGPADAALFPLP